jgi:hypothetical protein
MAEIKIKDKRKKIKEERAANILRYYREKAET